MKKSTLCGVVFAIAALVPAVASAQSTVTFNALILPSCAVTLGTPGVMVASEDGHALSSTGAGGLPGRAAVLATGSAFKAQIDPPLSFRLAPANGQPESITTTYAASGVTIAASASAGSPLSLGLGLTNLDINLAARKDAGVFPAGLYAADVLVRCVAN